MKQANNWENVENRAQLTSNKVKMRQSLNGHANRCVNNARTVEWAGSAESVLPAF